MGKVKIELNYAGVRKLLRSPEMMKACEERASKAAQSLGSGYEVTTHTGPNRVNAEIAAVTRKARRDNEQNDSILKALGG